MTMRGLVIVLFISALLLIPSSIADADDADLPNVVCEYWMCLDMVSVHSVEGFTVINRTGADQDMRNYYLTDGEGKLTFTEPLILENDAELTVLSDVPEDWMMIDSYIVYGERGVRADSKFKLADAGDDIHLMLGERRLDAFAWGTKYTDGWEYPGHGLDKIPKKTLAARNHAYHTERWEDNIWRVYTPGQTLKH